MYSLEVSSNGLEEDVKELVAAGTQVEDDNGGQHLIPWQPQDQPKQEEENSATRQTHHPDKEKEMTETRKERNANK